MEQSTDATAWDDPAVTMRITQRVLPGRERDFEEFLRGIDGEASLFPGYIGSQVTRPRRGNRVYQVVVRFDRASNLRRWQESEERRVWYARARELSEAEPLTVDITGTGQEHRLFQTLAPIGSFVRTSVSGIGLLLLGTALALIMANTPLSDTYERFWETELTIGTARYGITESLRHWVNDGLMALFFFIVGLEIKREFLVGSLRYPRQAALPISAAIGGAIVPATVYALFNLNGDAIHGWGVPIGTDTAFSLGMLSLLAARVRPLLLVFLTAFAIVDDILAVLVIAIFYTSAIVWSSLLIAVALLVALVVANHAGFHRWPLYAALGVAVWLAVFDSGVHGTIAGVLVSMTVPARSWINPSEFLMRGRQLMDEFEEACYLTPSMLSNEPQQEATQAIERLVEDVETPMTHLQHKLNPWVAFGVLPLFAFANAGIPLMEGLDEAWSSTVTWGVVAGLVVGKPVGIMLFSWLAVRCGLALKSPAIPWSNVGGVALLGGIGFTMSLFITELAFERGQTADTARVGIMLGSIVAGILGYFVLRATLPPPREEVVAPQGNHRDELDGDRSMTGTTATTGYIVDTPEIRALIEEAQERMRTTADDAERVELLKPTFQKLLQADGWLPEEYAQPGDTTGMGGGIAAYALYRSEDASLCLFSFVIPPAMTTPIHDHGSWGLVGLYRGRQEETYYDRVDDGSVPGKAVLELKERQTLEQGDFYPLLPGVRDIHSVGSTPGGPSISIHLLANDTGCVDRRQYDFEAQTVKPFRSGWSNVPCDDGTSS